MFVIENNIYF